MPRADTQESGFRLDVKALALKGGDNQGPDIIAGKAAESPIVRLVKSRDSDQRMPPEGPGLTTAEIAVLEGWINEGAVWPDGVDRVRLRDLRDHWSFKPLALEPGQHSIDDFIDRKLQELGLNRSPSPNPLRGSAAFRST